MKDVLDFLRDLSANNNRLWFNAHKARYMSARERWNEFAMDFACEMGARDPSVAGLELKDITYRIYRDTRFSHNKEPYKTHMGVFLAPGGKKSGHSGYYFQVSGCETADFFARHTAATGTYCYTQAALQVLREDMACDWQQFRRDVINVADSRFKPMMDGALRRVPRGFEADPDSLMGQWLRMKMVGVAMTVTDDFLLQPRLAQRLADIFATTKPLNGFLNRAIDFAAGL